MDPNNPNPYQQPQDPSVQPVGQPQHPQVVVGGTPQPAAPVQPAQPYYPQQPMAQSSGSNGSRNKLLFASKIMSIVILVMAGLIILVAHLLSHKIANTAVTSYGPGSSSSSAGSSSSTAANTTSKSACQLFALSDAQTFIGSGASGGNSNSPTLKDNVNNSICVYSSDSDSVTVAVSSAANSGGDSGISSSWSKIASAGLTPVSGVGDKAYYNSATKGLAVLKGNTIVSVLENKGNQSLQVQIAGLVISNF